MPFWSFLCDPRTGRWLLGTALCWLVFDFAHYGNSISAPEVLALLSPKTSLLDNTLLQLGIFVVFASPRYVLAILFMDKAGRESIQVLGFRVDDCRFGLITVVRPARRQPKPARFQQALLEDRLIKIEFR